MSQNCSPWKVATALAGIFIAGLLAGAFLCHAWCYREPPPRSSADHYTDRLLKRMTSEASLTSEQVEALRPIMQDFCHCLSSLRQKAYVEAAAVMREMDARIEAHLSPKQIEIYRKMQHCDRERWEQRRRENAAAPAP